MTMRLVTSVNLLILLLSLISLSAGAQSEIPAEAQSNRGILVKRITANGKAYDCVEFRRKDKTKVRAGTLKKNRFRPAYQKSLAKLKKALASASKRSRRALKLRIRRQSAARARLDELCSAAPMTAASRTECTAPCGVFFDAVDTNVPEVWRSGVAQALGYERLSRNVSGVHIKNLESNPSGNGNLLWSEINGLAWAAAGEESGPWVKPSDTRDLRLPSGNPAHYLDVFVDYDWLPRRYTRSEAIFGIAIKKIFYTMPAGKGRLKWEPILSGTTVTGNLSWASPGDDFGDPVEVTIKSVGKILLSGNKQSGLHIDTTDGVFPDTQIIEEVEVAAVEDTADAIAVWEGGISKAFSAYSYSWDFGDPGSGRWQTGAQLEDGRFPSKNTADGALAAHVFGAPGEYTVYLKVITDAGQERRYSQSIKVRAEPPGGWQTFYFSAGGDDDGGDGSQNSPYRTFNKAISLVGNNVRLLFKRGDTFAVDTPLGSVREIAGPFLLGAYGASSEERPHFIVANDINFVNGGNILDGRYLDLWASGSWPQARTIGRAFHEPGQDSLIMNSKSQGFMHAFTLGRNRNIIIQDSEALDSISYNPWVGGYVPRKAMLGTKVLYTNDNPLRSYTNKYLVSHCLVDQSSHSGNPDRLGGNMRIMASDGVKVSEDTGKWTVVSWNRFVNAGVSSSHSDSYEIVVTHARVCNNQFEFDKAEASNSISTHGAEHLVVCNNTASALKSNSFVGLIPGYNGKSYHYNGVKIFNNTYYVAGGAWARFIGGFESTGAHSSGIEVHNNLFSAPGASELPNSFFYRVPSLSPSFLSSDYNLFYMPLIPRPIEISTVSHETMESWRQASGNDSHTLLSDPFLADPDGGDLRIRSTSPAREAGTHSVLPYGRIDAGGRERPRGERVDIGAYEYGG